MYRDKTFHPLPWTYPDYAGEEVIGMLARIREKYVLQLKGKAAGDGPMAGEPGFREITCDDEEFQ